MLLFFDTEKKSSNLFSLNFSNGTLPSGVSFACASKASYVNSSGIVMSAANDTPRFSYDPLTLSFRGLLLERSATNYMYASVPTYFSQENCAVTLSAAVAPDGTTSAVSLVPNASNTNHDYYIIRDWGIPANAPATWSIFAKNNGYNFVVMKSGNNSGAYVVVVDLTTGNVTQQNYYKAGGSNASVTVTQAGNGWVRISTTLTTSNTGGFCVAPSSTGTPSYDTWDNPKFAGDSVSGILIWGVQGEAGSGVTTYIPTTSSATTRAADALSFTIPAGVGSLVYKFDDNSTQTVAVSAGAYTVPTTLNRAWIKSIVGRA